jgi:hypothetical protein
VEEAELNRRAREDEGLAETLAGYRAFPEEDHEARLKRLRDKAPRRAARTLRRKLSIAAGISLIIAASLFVFNRSESLDREASSADEVETLASSEAPEETATAKEIVPPVSPVSPAESSLAKPASASKEKAANGLGKSSAPEAKKQEAREETLAPALAADEPVMEQAAAEDDFAEESEAEPASITLGSELPPSSTSDLAFEAAPAPALARTRNSISIPPSANFIRGYVTDDQDRPVAKANVTLPGQPIGEYTDSTGYFSLAGDKTIRRFKVSHPLFESTEVELPRGENEVQISLSSSTPSAETEEEDWFFDGARTTIYPNRKKSSAAPTGGLKQLRESMQSDKPAELPGGKVKVSFSVQADGSLTDLEFGSQSEAELIDYVRNYLQQRSNWVFDGDGKNPVRMVLTFRFD